MASYNVSKLEKTLAESMAFSREDLTPYFNTSTDEAFMYEDEAQSSLLPSQFEPYELTEDINDGTLPIHPNKPRKPMFPR